MVKLWKEVQVAVTSAPGTSVVSGFITDRSQWCHSGLQRPMVLPARALTVQVKLTLIQPQDLALG